MKNIFNLSILAILGLALTFAACEKNNATIDQVFATDNNGNVYDVIKVGRKS